jgi:hypothetical protein
VARRGLRTGDVLHGDVVDWSAEDALAEQNERKVDVQHSDIVVAEAQGAEQQPVSELPPRAGENLPLAIRIAAGLLDEHNHLVPVGDGDHLVGQLGEVRETQLRNSQADRSRSARTQRSRGEIRAISELVDRSQNPGAGRLGDVRVIMDDVRHRLERDAGEFGDIAQGRGHSATVVTRGGAVLSRTTRFVARSSRVTPSVAPSLIRITRRVASSAMRRSG